MTVERARVIKGAFAAATRRAQVPSERARRIPRAILDSRADAERIAEDAKARAARVVADAREAAEVAAAAAARDAREQEIAKLAARFVALRAEDDRRAERDLERAVELAVLLAERLVGEALRIAPERIGELAAAALAGARGARRVRIDACPADITALRAALGSIGFAAEVVADDALARGSLVVHTDLGRIDARLEPQLVRLAAALREALA